MLSEHELKAGLPHPVDAVLALLGLVVTAPLIALAALAVLITSRGPVFFRQERVGRYGRPFVMFKLRTMRTTTAGPLVTSKGDRRVTPVGRVLRKLKIDELPELWNVVAGDMALVGPRPEVPRYVDLANPAWQQVLLVRPGITDPVTTQLRDEEALLASAEDSERFYLHTLQPYKLKGYLAYLRARNWLSDLKVLGRTALAILLPRTAGPLKVQDIRFTRANNR